MTKEFLQTVYDNGLLWYLVRGVDDGVSNSLSDDSSAKCTAKKILATLPEINMDETTRAKMSIYLDGIIHCITIDAENFLI